MRAAMAVAAISKLANRMATQRGRMGIFQFFRRPSFAGAQTLRARRAVGNRPENAPVSAPSPSPLPLVPRRQRLVASRLQVGRVDAIVTLLRGPPENVSREHLYQRLSGLCR